MPTQSISWWGLYQEAIHRLEADIHYWAADEFKTCSVVIARLLPCSQWVLTVSEVCLKALQRCLYEWPTCLPLPWQPVLGLFSFFFPLPFSPHTCPVAQSSLADIAACMNYGNVHMAQLPCTAALSGFIFTAKFILGGKVEGRKTENVCSAICLTQGTAYASTGIIIGQN